MTAATLIMRRPRSSVAIADHHDENRLALSHAIEFARAARRLLDALGTARQAVISAQTQVKVAGPVYQHFSGVRAFKRAKMKVQGTAIEISQSEAWSTAQCQNQKAPLLL